MYNKRGALALTLLSIAITCPHSLASSTETDAAKPYRLIILADMGNEEDEMQQMMHMLMCSNEFHLEGLIAVTGKYLHPRQSNPYKRVLHPELFHELIDGYAKVVDNLRLHASGWHDPDYLRSIVTTGQSGYGIADVGPGKSSPGSRLIIEAIERDDPRPIRIVVNAGSNTLAQALIDLKATYSDEELKAAVLKLRVFENGSQDNCGAWIAHNFPQIHWLRSNTQTYCYGGPGWNDRANIGPYVWEPYENTELGQNFWALKHIVAEHGPLGSLYPLRVFPRGDLRHLEGGGTIPWMGLVNKGLFDIDQPSWGGWSGRFSRAKVKNYFAHHDDVRADEQSARPFYLHAEVEDTWTDPRNGETTTNLWNPVWRFRRAMYQDFQCRMDWCVQPYQNANHHPVAVINGDATDSIIRMTATAGQRLVFDATGSHDPDGDGLEIHWWIYKEAGTYAKKLQLETIDANAPVKASLTLPRNTAGHQIHLILEIKDRGSIASLYDYRRIVIDVTK